MSVIEERKRQGKKGSRNARRDRARQREYDKNRRVALTTEQREAINENVDSQ